MTVSIDKKMVKLKESLLFLGSAVESNLQRAVKAWRDNDQDLAQEVRQTDTEIDAFEINLEDDCLAILALQQPVAGDLRFIVTALKINIDLERIGDLAVNIAERAADLAQAPALPPVHDLAKLAELSQGQLEKALDAFVTGDVESAQEVMAGDELLDAVYLKVFNELLTLMMEDPRSIRRATSLMFAAKHLERFGDHATNLAEMVVFMVRGTDVRHPRSRGDA
jgi:phosphate transport system protein